MAQVVSRKSIENFKSALANGGVRPTMFSVEITFPQIVVNNQAELSEKALFLVKAATLPGSQIGIIDVPFRGRKLKVSGDRNFADWQTTIVNDTDFQLRKAMEKWAETIQNMNFAIGENELENYFGTAEVRQLDRQGKQLRVYEFNGIWPNNIAEIPLSFETQDTIEEYDVAFCVQYWHAAGQNAETVNGINQWQAPESNKSQIISWYYYQINQRGVYPPLFYGTKYR